MKNHSFCEIVLKVNHFNVRIRDYSLVSALQLLRKIPKVLTLGETGCIFSVLDESAHSLSGPNNHSLEQLTSRRRHS